MSSSLCAHRIQAGRDGTTPQSIPGVRILLELSWSGKLRRLMTLKPVASYRFSRAERGGVGRGLGPGRAAHTGLQLLAQGALP